MKPEISIIIPTYNRPERLRQCLQALCAQRHSSFEVIVVDDGSPEPAEAVVAAFHERLSIRCVRQTNAGPAAARNRGAAEAAGHILAFTDDDCMPDPGWLDAFDGALRTEPDALVGGSIVNDLADNICSEVSQDLITFLYDYDGAGDSGLDFFTSNNIACTKEAFHKQGGFDDSFPLPAAEDRDFGMRWSERGCPLTFVPAAKVKHAHSLTLKQFWTQHQNYGRGALHLRRRIRDRRRPALRFAGLRFYWSMMAYPYRTRLKRPVARMVLLGMSQLATVSGFLRQSIHGTDKVRRMPKPLGQRDVL
ncbi:MAG: glycosyltransferase family 2 protein [Alphaproteobacteria bacterium]